jgi:predicted transcriptional regulator
MITSDAKIKQMEISAIITRADGTIEDLGTIQYWHKNPLKRLLWRIKKWLHS